jgi:16S rRNA (guanine527-N7)-methyltransferase
MIMTKISDQMIQEALAPYGVAVTSDLCERIRIYVSLLLRWNQKISLTTVTNHLKILQFHFGESFFAASKLPMVNSRLADVGSGAGFPGLPIHLISHDLEVVLIESNAKKSAFLSEVARELNLDHVTVINERMETLANEIPMFDFIVARALGQHDKFLDWASSRLKPDGMVVLWLGEDDAFVVSDIPGWKWREPLKLPLSERRFILVGSKDS